MLLALDEIRRRLDDEFVPLGSGFSEFRLRPPGLSAKQVRDLKRTLALAQLPESFDDLIQRYDFGAFRLGGVWFGSTGRYDEYLLSKNRAEARWWGSGRRPERHLAIASSDGYLFLLDTVAGSVEAYLRTAFWEGRLVAASSFEAFLCGAGTQFLERERFRTEPALVLELHREVGAAPTSNFWQELALGIT